MPGLFCPEVCPSHKGGEGMSAEVYDPTGEVAAAGGIAAYVAANKSAGVQREVGTSVLALNFENTSSGSIE